MVNSPFQLVDFTIQGQSPCDVQVLFALFPMVSYFGTIIAKYKQEFVKTSKILWRDKHYNEQKQYETACCTHDHRIHHDDNPFRSRQV